MALVLDATSGGAAANTYLLVAAADTYFEGHLWKTDWTGATLGNKEAALVMATRTLDAMYDWVQYPSSNTQALQWPRKGVEDFLRLTYILNTVIPVKLKEATAELAKALLASNVTAESQIETQGLTSLTVGSISLAFSDDVMAKVVPDVVRNLIPIWWGFLRGPSLNSPVVHA